MEIDLHQRLVHLQRRRHRPRALISDRIPYTRRRHVSPIIRILAAQTPALTAEIDLRHRSVHLQRLRRRSRAFSSDRIPYARLFTSVLIQVSSPLPSHHFASRSM